MTARRCPGCDTEHSFSALSCPHCRRLVHGDELKALAARAEDARRREDKGEERAAWRQAAPLLPPESKQRQAIEQRLQALEDDAKAAPREERPGWTRVGGALGAAAFVLWKFKSLLLLVLGKAKFLVTGLSKGGTLFSFLASWGLYWSLWGWRYALGFLAAMYVHEMGHVAALRHFGIPASAPMFVPGLGAFVRMNAHPKTPGQDARIGLAGPEWGAGAAVAAYIVFWGTGEPLWAAIGHSAAFLNLFNLLPVWQLDGGRAFAALTRLERAAVAAGFATAWAMSGEGLFGLLFVVAGFRAFQSDPALRGDIEVLGRFLWLVALFAAMLMLGGGR